MHIKQHNIVLIGMPASGKSTIGVLLAKQLSRWFIDTDVCIQYLEGRPLQTIINEDGLEYFRKVEQEHILKIEASNAVIATGGSVVYSDAAMKKLSSNSIILFLDLPLEHIKQRLTNLGSRGVVMEKHQSLESLYKQRQPLYQKYSQITIDCTGQNHEQTLTAIIKALDN